MRPVKLNLVDRVVQFFSPKASFERIRYKAALSSLEEQGYVVAGSSARTMRAWNASANSADEDVLPKLDALRASSRDLYMNTPVATAALRRERTNVVGFGLRLQSRIDREALGLSVEAARAWERSTQREFFSWANTIECDAARTQNFNQLCNLAFFTPSLSGDCFVLLPLIPRNGQLYDLRIQILEGDSCSNPMSAFDTPRLAGGVEVDRFGAPIAYHFRKPNFIGAIGLNYNATMEWERITAYGENSGRRQVLHLFEKERPGQRRGVPLLAPVIEELKMLTRLSKAELQAAVINSFFTVFIKTITPQGTALAEGYVPPSSSATGTGAAVTNSTSNPEDANVYEMGAANIVQMSNDQDISLADPKRPNQAFEPFFLAIVTQIGAALGIPKEELILQFTSSYSAAKAAMQEAWKHYRQRRVWIASTFCQPIYEEFLTEAILKGRIVAPGFFEDPVLHAAWCCASWSGPGQGQLDPLKETKAEVLKIQNRLSTYGDSYSSIAGDDWESAMGRASQEESLLEELDLLPLVTTRVKEPGVKEPDVEEPDVKEPGGNTPPVDEDTADEDTDEQSSGDKNE